MIRLKAPFNDLPRDGAKTVIMKPSVTYYQKVLFWFFCNFVHNNFVHNMNRQYITPMDIEITTKAMDIIAKRTPDVIKATRTDEIQADNPCPFNLKQVSYGLQAGIKFTWNSNNLEHLTIALQSTAKTFSYYLAKLLYQQGTKISICHLKSEITQFFIDEFKATVIVSPKKIYDLKYNIFLPTAAISDLSNLKTLNRLKAFISISLGNNQLAYQKYGIIVHQCGLLYVINTEKLIQTASMHDCHNVDITKKLIEQLYYDFLLELFNCFIKEKN